MSETASPAPTTGRCIYGFVLFLVSIAMLVIYLIWAIVPTVWFDAIGVTYLPSKYWSLAFPVFVCWAIFVFATCLYPSINFMFTPSLDSPNTVTDKWALRTAHMFNHNNVGIAPISDLPLDFVCHQLYS